MNDTTACRYTSIQRTGHQAGQYDPLPRPPELPAGLAENPRVLLLANLDDISRGLAGDTPPGRASYRDVERCLGIVQATAHLLDPQSRIRCAASAATAAYYLDALTASGNNEWLVCPGTYDVSQALLEEMADLVYVRLIATAPERGRPKRHVDLVTSGPRPHLRAAGHAASAARDPNLAHRARPLRRRVALQVLVRRAVHRLAFIRSGCRLSARAQAGRRSLLGSSRCGRLKRRWTPPPRGGVHPRSIRP